MNPKDESPALSDNITLREEVEITDSPASEANAQNDPHDVQLNDSAQDSATKVETNSKLDSAIELENFNLVETLGEGGMGKVFRAHNKALDKDMAIKVMKPELVGDRAARKRFEKEAAAAGALTHPNIAQVFSCSANGDTPFLVMEFVDGVSLAEILNHEHRLSPDRVVSIALQICDALDYAHQRGVVHRDLKPSNIIVVEHNGGDNVKIVDFGIAKLAPKHEGMTALTQNGEIFGSPAYMSPEQAQGVDVQFSSDLYSLGCIMFEALAGHPLFTGDNGIQILMKQLNSPINKQMRQLRQRGISRSLVAIIRKLLNKRPGRRYQTASELAAELRSTQQHRLPKAMMIPIFQKVGAAIAVVGAVSFACFNYHQSIPSLIPAAPSLIPAAPSLNPAAITEQIGLPDNASASELIKRVEANEEDSWKFMTTSRLTGDALQQRARSDRALREECTRRLQAMGPKIIPEMIHGLQNSTMTSQICEDVLASFDKASVEPVLEALRQNPNNEKLITTLFLIGQPAVEQLVDVIRTGSANEVKSAAETLAGITQLSTLQSPPALMFRLRGKLIGNGDLQSSRKLLRDSDEQTLLNALNRTSIETVRKNLLTIMASIDGPDRNTINKVGDLLKHDASEDVRQAAAKMLGHVLSTQSPDSAVETIKILIAALSQDPSSTVRAVCANSIEQGAPNAKIAIAPLRHSLHDPVNSVRESALKALVGMATTYPESKPDLLLALKDLDPNTVHAALSVMERMGPACKDAVPLLIKVGRAYDRRNTNEVLEVLKNIGPEAARQSVPFMIECLKLPSAQWPIKNTATEALAAMGPEAKSAIPALKEAGSTNAYARQALRALGAE